MIDADNPQVTVDEAAEEPTPTEDMGFCESCEKEVPESELEQVEVEKPDREYPGCYEDWCAECRDDTP